MLFEGQQRVHRRNNNKNAWLLGWFKYVYVLHWMPFALLAATWFGGYIIHANINSPVIVLYYAAHIFSAVAFIAVGMFYLHPGNKETESRLHPTAPNSVTKVTHHIIFHVLKLQPVVGVLIFFVPDNGLKLGKDGSFWTNHVYNDNYAHMVHAMMFYTIILLGLVNSVFMLNKHRKARK